VNGEIDASIKRIALSIWQHFGTCQPKKRKKKKKQKRENAAANDFVDKSLCKERRPRLN